MSEVNNYVQSKVLELVKKGVDVTPCIVLQLRKDFINHRNNYNNKILAAVDAEISKHRKSKNKVFTKDVTFAYFGSKDEAYFSEEEMINGYKAPKYSELSKQEKELWHEKENQNQEL